MLRGSTFYPTTLALSTRPIITTRLYTTTLTNHSLPKKKEECLSVQICKQEILPCALRIIGLGGLFFKLQLPILDSRHHKIRIEAGHMDF